MKSGESIRSRRRSPARDPLRKVAGVGRVRSAAEERIGLRPVIDRVFGFDEVPAALRRLQAGSHFGKICIQL